MSDDEDLARAALAALASVDAPATLRERTNVAVGQRRHRNRLRLVVASAVATVVVVSGAATIAAAASGHRNAKVSVVSGETSVTSSTTDSTAASSTSIPTSTVAPASTTTVGTPRPTRGPGTDIVTTPTSAVPGPAELHASPDTGLSERTSIVVSGSGLPPSRLVHVVACRALAPPSTDAGPPGCDNTDWWNSGASDFFTDAQGSLRTQEFFVRRVFADGTDCTTTPGGCELRLIGNSGADILARAPISFAGPSGPSRPPGMQVTPATGLADGQAVQVAGRNFVSASTTVVECAGTTCEETGPEVTPGADGSFTLTFTAHRTFTTGTGVRVDCLTAACIIGISPVGDDRVPIVFAPPSPPPTSTTTSIP